MITFEERVEQLELWPATECKKKRTAMKPHKLQTNRYLEA